MPIKSRSQMKLMYAAAQGKSDKVPKEVAKKFISETPKNTFSKLKERIGKKK